MRFSRFFCGGRLLWSVLISGPALAWSFAIGRGHGVSDAVSYPDPAWISVILCGVPIVVYALRKLISAGSIRAGLLVSVAMTASVCIGEIFAAGEVAFLMALGELFETRTLKKARDGIDSLSRMAPSSASVVKDGEEKEVPVSQIRRGDVVRIRPGGSVPVDGLVLSGFTAVDESLMTGESVPVEKKAGDRVTSGTVNTYGTVDVVSESDSGDSTFDRILKMMREAHDARAPVVRLADKCATYLIVGAFFAALCVWLASGDIVRGVTILIVFCPCAFALAAPTAAGACMAVLSRNGVLVKSGEALETMGKVRAMAFDKTGTLTYGHPAVEKVAASEPFDADGVLRLAAAAERGSEHPIGRAIFSGVRDGVPESSCFRMHHGRGVEASVCGERVLAGSRGWLEENGVKIGEAETAAADLDMASGRTVVYVSSGGRYAGRIILSDMLRKESRDVVSRLHRSGVSHIALLTGDNPAAAGVAAEAAGADEVRAELLPADKARAVVDLAVRYGTVAMVGDGVNDAVALETADVGVAMGGRGSDVSVGAADIVLMHDNLHMIPFLVSMTRDTLRNIRVNIVFSIFINAVSITLAAAGVLGPVSGAVLHNCSSLFVVGHAASLLRRRPEHGSE